MKPLNQRKKLNRRNMLRGTGAVIALPFLESLAASRQLNASESTTNNGTRETPMRMVCIGLEYGLYPIDFFPKRTGRDYELPRLLSPLGGLKNEFTVFSGLDHPGISGGHQATHTFLSGIRSNQAKQYPEGNLTIDQKAAEHVGAQTRYQSLQLGIGGGGVSWSRNGVEIPTIDRLQTVFDALFEETPKSKRTRQAGTYAVNRSILDVVGEDAAAMKKRVSVGDSTKLDEYFTSIREVEKRLEQSAAWWNKPKAKTNFKLPKTPPTSFTEQVALFYDLMKLALQTDSTRVISMAIHGWKGDSGLSGVTKGYHDLSHHGRDETKLNQLGIIEQFHTGQLARFLGSLKETQADDDASLLDRTMVLFGSGLGNASSHSNRELPLLLAGGGFQHGEHKAYPADGGVKTPACNLYLSMLQRFGVESDRFGTSTGTLEGLG
ncbi:DUF1552 domain-containing protein [Stieleria sp. TO1_6]|uniref:DUF1552 domain-containing protein n=1 Tax=Stieleria tagensis TaxID=2956795 RepID=UPI00209AB1B9|nr:DUF1552 domain-containing protein [Stieleria tagensis]MCO8121233.1 DUF1552 domain-containing protein [Stieleria tagensis]